MLLSLEKNFVFVHIPKTGGQSITAALSPWSVRPPRTQWRRLISHLPVREAPEKAYLRAHDKASWIRRKLTPAVYDGLYRFATVRNPYDYAVSYYHYLREHPGSRRHADALSWSFSDFVGYLERKHRLRRIDQSSWIFDRAGTPLVDRVLSFEHLADDFREVAHDIGVDRVGLRHFNGSTRGDYRDYYDTRSRTTVEHIFSRDLDRFGYTF